MQLVPAGLGDTLSRQAEGIGEKVAGVAAADVDRAARFPARRSQRCAPSPFSPFSSPPNSEASARRLGRSPTWCSSSVNTARRPP